MSETLKIATYQGPVADACIEKNIETVLKVLAKHRDEQFDFLCFPETFLSGYTKNAIEHASLSLEDYRIKELIHKSSIYDTVILVGINEQRRDKIYNSQMVIYKGNLLGVSTKTMLTTGFDSEYYSTDLELPVYSAKGIKFGVAICHTTSFVQPSLLLRLRGARLLFTPHFNNLPAVSLLPNGETLTYEQHKKMVLTNQAGLASLLKMVVVRSNIVECNEKAIASGDSGIWDMNGNLVVCTQAFTEQVVSHVFPKSIFNKEHWISHQEIPTKLYEMIAKAGENYLNEE